jgi:multidrug resistance efflux pump
MRAAIAVQEEKLRLAEAELSPITLRVPIDGMVSKVHRRSGETILAGESILTISAQSSDHIIGYMRQPLPFEPKVGMAVQIRSRSSGRQICNSKILQVGTQMEPIGASSLSLANTHQLETGLPILINLPAELKLRPGELVELKFHPF